MSEAEFRYIRNACQERRREPAGEWATLIMDGAEPVSVAATGPRRRAAMAVTGGRRSLESDRPAHDSRQQLTMVGTGAQVAAARYRFRVTRYPPRMIAIAVSLAVLAGFIDAVAWLALAGFFASFMSGNSTRLGIGLATGDWRSTVVAGALVLSFLSGVVVAALVSHWRSGRHKPAVMILVTGTITVAAVVAWAGAQMPALLLLAFAMGAENGVFNRDGEVTIGLTYMTGTLVRLGQRMAATFLRLPGDHSPIPYLLLWLGFVGGAVAGASASRLPLAVTLTIAAALSATLTLAVRFVGQPSARNEHRVA